MKSADLGVGGGKNDPDVLLVMGKPPDSAETGKHDMTKWREMVEKCRRIIHFLATSSCKHNFDISWTLFSWLSTVSGDRGGEFARTSLPARCVDRQPRVLSLAADGLLVVMVC